MEKVWRILLKLGIISYETFTKKVDGFIEFDADELEHLFECMEDDLPF